MRKRLSSIAGIVITGYSAATLAGGPAFSGVTTDISSAQIAVSNPAGMAFLPAGTHKSVGLIVGVGLGEFEIDEELTSVDGGDPDNETAPVFVPSGYYARPINENWHWGVGLYIPSGFGSDYGSDWAGRYYSESFSLVYVALAPALSYRINDQWSVGGAVNITYNYNESVSRIPNLEPGSGDGKLEFEGDAVGFNGSLSLMYQPRTGTRFGLLYASEASTDVEGDLKFKNIGPVLEEVLGEAGLLNTDLEVENIMPARVQLGAHHTLGNGHYITGDTMWVDFSEFATGDISLEGTDIAQPKGIYDDIWIFSVGYNIPLDARRTLKLGALHVTQAVDDEKRTLTMRMDEVWGLGVGMGYKLEQSNLDINLDLTYSGDAPVDTGEKLRGRVVGESKDPYALILDVAWHF